MGSAPVDVPVRVHVYGTRACVCAEMGTTEQLASTKVLEVRCVK